jgi:predicted dehydrogenase
MTTMQRREFMARAGQAGAWALAASAATGGARAGATPPRLRLGQIGTGHAHADGKLAVLRRSPDFEVVGVVEPDERLRRLAQVRKDYQGVTWLTEEQLFATPGLCAVAVETEVRDLLATGQRCIDAGLHVHLDKPAGESLPACRRLFERAARRGLTVQLGYMFRYNPGFEFCFRAAREGWLGRVFAVEAVIGKVSGVEERRKLLPYRGGTMFELGCHLIDAVVTLLGAPRAVTAYARSVGAAADGLLDNQLATLEYPDALVTVRSSVVEVGGGSRRQFVVCGDGGTVDLRPLEPPALRLALARPRGKFRAGYQEVKLPALPRYAADFADLARVIRGEKAFAWTPAHDLAVQETVLRASGLPVS